MQIWDQARSMEEELVQVKCKLEIVEIDHAGVELDQSIAKDSCEMIQCHLNYSITRIKELTQELESAY